MSTNPWLIACLGAIASCSGNYAATVAGKRHYDTRESCSHEIFDAGHVLFPQIRIPKALFMLLESLWLPFLFQVPWSVSKALAADIAVRLGALFALRAVTNVVTILPRDQECDASKPWSLRNFIAGACYDKVFSGHLAFAMIISLAFVSYNVWPAWTGWLYSSVMAMLMVFSRGHYTVDLVLAAALAYLSWQHPVFKTFAT